MLAKKTNKSYNELNYKKDFIPTNDFKRAVDDVKQVLNVILQNVQKNNDNFNAINFNNVLLKFGNCDFNDSYYIELARFNKWKIVTDDADFFNSKFEIDIITHNIRPSSRF